VVTTGTVILSSVTTGVLVTTVSTTNGSNGAGAGVDVDNVRKIEFLNNF
jgi:hypothetical protein